MGTVAFFRRLAPALLLSPMFSISSFLISICITLITLMSLCSLSVLLRTPCLSNPSPSFSQTPNSPDPGPIRPANTAYGTAHRSSLLQKLISKPNIRNEKKKKKQSCLPSDCGWSGHMNSRVTWLGECYFLLSDLMPTTFTPPVKYSSGLST